MRVHTHIRTHTHTHSHTNFSSQNDNTYQSILIFFFFFQKSEKGQTGQRDLGTQGSWGWGDGGVLKFIGIVLWALISCACPFCRKTCSHCLRIPGCRCQSSGTSCPLVWAPRSGSSEARSWRRRWPESRSRGWWGWSGSGSLGSRAPWWGLAESFPAVSGPEWAGRWTPCRFAWRRKKQIKHLIGKSAETTDHKIHTFINEHYKKFSICQACYILCQWQLQPLSGDTYLAARSMFLRELTSLRSTCGLPRYSAIAFAGNSVSHT